MTDRHCAWCHQPLPATAREDRLTCSKRCRQARARFRHGVGVAPAGAPNGRALRLAYADPPYPGTARKYYSGHPDYAGEVDHAELIAQLVDGFDGWALSTSAAALPDVLRLCPPGVRVAAWIRGARVNVRARGPLNAWEPVIFAGGRLHVAARSTTPDPSRQSRRTDVLIYHSGVRTTDPGRVIGSKPPQFCRWVFDLLGATPGDDMVDIFPGSGGVGRAWDRFCDLNDDRRAS